MLVGLCAIPTSYSKGQFSPVKYIVKPDLSSGASQIEAADLDADGDEDILVLSEAGHPAHFIENTEDTTEFVFHPITQCWDDFSAFADIDADGLLDVVLRVGPTTVTEAWWYRNLGGFEFADGQYLIYDYVRFADMDGDSDVDIYCGINNSSGTLGIQIARNDGQAQFTAVTQPIPPMGSFDWNRDLLIDVENDGDMDIVGYMSNTGGVVPRIFLNVGQLTFQQGTTGVELCGETWRSLDIDADGLLDIVEFCDDGEMRSRVNQGDGTFSLPTAVDNVTHDVSWGDRIAFFDMDVDGDLDILGQRNEFGEDFYRNYVNENLGEGVFSERVEVPRLDSVDLILSAGVFLDWNGDGSLEFIGPELNWERVLLFDVGSDGSFAFKYPVAGNTPTDGFKVVDLNGDGLPDIVQATPEGSLVVLFNEGAAGFSREHILATNTGPGEVLVVDIDGDADLDVIAPGYDAPIILVNNGDLAYEEVDDSNFPRISSGPALVEDLDQDGYIDVFKTNSGALSRYRNLNGTFFLSIGSGAVFNPEISSFLGLRDVDQDGDSDIIYRSYSLVNSPIRWLRNDGDLSFPVSADLPIERDARVIEFSDVDMDGIEDLLLLDQGVGVWPPVGGVFIKYGLGDEVYSVIDTIVPSGSGTGIYLLSDVDRDGAPDLVRWTSGSPEPSVQMNNGSGAFIDELPLTSANLNLRLDYGYVRYFDMADMDNDGDDDLVFTTIDSLAPCQTRRSLAWSENFAADAFELSGETFLDLDGDGQRTVDEPGTSAATVLSEPVGYAAWGDTAGQFTLHSNAEFQTVAAAPPSAFWSQSTTPPEYTVEPSASQPVWTGLDFGFAPVVDTSSIHAEVVLASAPCSSVTSLWITLRNDGTRVEQGSITLGLNSGFEFIGSEVAPTSASASSIVWSFDSLQYFSTLVLHAEVRMPGTDFLGTPYILPVSVNTVDVAGLGTGVFTAEWASVLACAYDPNDKLVDPKGYGTYGAVPIDQDVMDYTIRFQNTGNAPAVDVVLRDQLVDAIEPSRLQVLGYSHVPTMVAVEPSGEVVVRFNGIQLPDSGASFTASQGFIKFRVGLVEGLPNYTEVVNTAEIYFDNNEPVITNSTRTTLVDCSEWQPVITPRFGPIFDVTEGDSYQWYLNGDLLDGATASSLFVTELGDYSAMVTSQYGCEATSEIYSITEVGIVEQGRRNMLLVPNPTVADARLLFDAVLPNSATLEIVDVTGRISLITQVGGRDVALINVGGFAAGVYQLILRENGSYTGMTRMIVE